MTTWRVYTYITYMTLYHDYGVCMIVFHQLFQKRRFIPVLTSLDQNDLQEIAYFFLLATTAAARNNYHVFHHNSLVLH